MSAHFHTFFFRNVAFHNKRNCTKYTERDTTTFPLLSYIDQDSYMEEIFMRSCKYKVKTYSWSLGCGRNTHLESLNKETGKKKTEPISEQRPSQAVWCSWDPAQPARPGHLQTTYRVEGRCPQPGSLGGFEKENMWRASFRSLSLKLKKPFLEKSKTDYKCSYIFNRKKKERAITGQQDRWKGRTAVSIIMGESRNYNRGYFRRVKPLWFLHCTLRSSYNPNESRT